MEYKILDYIIENYYDYTFTIIVGYNDCVIGWCGESKRLIYSSKLIIDKIMHEQKLDYIDALEHFGFNILDAYFENKPIICEDHGI